MNYSKKDNVTKRENILNKAAFPALVMMAPTISIVTDQVSKSLVRVAFEGGVELHPDIFAPGWNTGINFGLFSGGGAQHLIIVIVGIALSFGALGYGVIGWVMNKLSMRQSLGLALVAGGGISNIIDRFSYGAVFDFLSPQCCGLDNPWSFNMADIFVFIGILMFVFPARKKRK